MPLTETGKPAPHHVFDNPDEARRAISAAVEYLIEVDGYSIEDVKNYCNEEAELYREGE